ncbi:MAG: YceI family protein [Bryobacterales bacterium]|nr:YceI family protein [Acidobacteriota bacterium]MCB9383982.1 YceI family protein [Bryobacterales bacterium]
MKPTIAVLFLACAGLQAQPVRLLFEPANTKVEYSVASTLHTVHGTFALESGDVTYDPATGKASGLIVVDATSGDSGNGSRDKRMHTAILESVSFPEVKFVPDHVTVHEGAAAGDSVLELHGQFYLHGTPHELVIKAATHPHEGRVKITSDFQVPYVDWGLESASRFILKVADTVDIHIEADAKSVHDGV